MEAQAEQSSSDTNISTPLIQQPQPTTAQPSPAPPSPSRPIPTLRFPRPQGNQKLANWISSSSADIMAPSSLNEDSSMGDSTYELIGGTDDESLDGRGTESIADSTDLDAYPRPDDVHSVSGTDNSGYPTESEDEEPEGQEEEEQHSHTSSIRYADEALGSPSAQATTHLGYVSQAESTSLLEPIEFNEVESPIYLDKISVKHTIQDFNEDETADIAESLHIANPPARLIATVRQTMSQGCLSTREPIRVLYVGHRAAERDIVYKISRAITSSQVTDYTSGKTVRRTTDGLYNIVPVGSFGSFKDPEVELMETSGYQIKVEPCTVAEKEVVPGSRFPDDIVYSLTIDEEKKYKSTLGAGGAQLQPAWSLPHIAIFYCTPSDDETAQNTREFAWEFANRHGIPSVFIAETQSFNQPLPGRWEDFIDPHAVHLSIESRDPEHPIPPIRFPIDFASFINIDHRQMNRNLAYLTGLQEPASAAEELIGDVIALSDDESLSEPELVSSSLFTKFDEVFQDAFGSRTIYVVAALVGVIISNMLASYVFPSHGPVPATAPAAPVATVLSTSSSAISTSTATVTINLTSTKTVRITSAEPSAISMLPFGGFLSDKAQTTTTESEVKSTVCSVEMYSGNEILIKVPTGTKTSWLAKGAIDIDICRGSDPVKSRLSTVDEGILVEINQKDAYGVLNVSVVTTRKPKINETFAVDFGRPLIVEAFEAGKDLLEEMAKKFAGTAADAAKVVEDSCAPVLNSVADKIKDEAASFTDSVKDAGKAAHGYSSRFSSETVDRVKDTLQSNSVGKLLQGAQDVVTQQIRSVQGIRKDVDISILKAQVASKLWWLKVQGKTAEYEEYERKASGFLKMIHDEALKAKQAHNANLRSSKCSWRTGSCGEARKPKGLTHKWKPFRN